MAYSHQLRHRNLHKMHGQLGDLVARDAQKPDTNGNGNGNNKNSNTKTDANSVANTDVASSAQTTFLSVVLVTASPTFTGEIAGYTTLTPSAAEVSSPQQSNTYVAPQPSNVETSSSQYVWTPPSSSAAPVETTTQAPAAPASTSWEPATTYVPTTASSLSAVVHSSSSVIPSSTLPTSIVFAVSSSGLSSSYSSYSRTTTRSLSTMAPSSTATAAASSSEGMSSGGKAGLAIGIILLIALLAGGVLWFYWKKKKDNDDWHKADDEKVGFGGAAAVMPTKRQSTKSFLGRSQKHDSNAPRLSLRPVTQFVPDLAAAAKKRLSQGNPLDTANKPAGMAAAGAGRSLTRDDPNGSPWERRAAGDAPANPFQDPVNPFRDQAKGPPPPNVTVTPPMSDDGSSVNATTAIGAGAATGIAGAAILAAGAKNGNGQSKNGPTSPEGVPAPGRAPPGGGGPPPGNVHRVQLDFKPSMEDELELSAGGLVRLLHEYDDGWALCIRLDRSQQGVAPRTCLSARPVKPRPTNGSPRMGPNGRPMSPAQVRPGSPGQGRPMSPSQGRPGSPALGPGPRPKSPASSLGPSRPGTANSNRPLSPPTLAPLPMMPQNANQMTPGQFNQAPRPLSPGPIGRSPNPQQSKRSQSPGPYGARTGPASMSTNQRRRSNSTGAVQARRNSPPGTSPLGRLDPMPGWIPPKPQNNPQPVRGAAF